MRYLLTLIIGIAIGFGVATWEPARDMVSVERVASLVSSIRKTASTEDEGVPAEKDGGEIRWLAEMALIGSDIALSNFFADFPEDLDVDGSTDFVNVFTAPSSFRTAVFALSEAEASQQTLAQASENVSDEQTIAQFEALQNLIAAENALIDQALLQVEPQHPQAFLFHCIRASNESMIAIFDFWIQVARDKDVLPGTLATLSQSFSENRAKIADFADRGRAAADGYTRYYQVIPAKTESDRVIKSKVLEMLSSYKFSFDVEDALANHDLEFVSILNEPVESEQAAATRLEAWALARQRLAQARLDAQQERQQISAEIMQLTPTS